MVSLRAMVEAKGALLTGAKAEAIFRQEVGLGGVSATEMVHAAVSKATPAGQTGHLAMAWQRRILTMGVPFESQVFNPMPYGEVVEKGSRPHVILPRYKKALAFLPGGGSFAERFRSGDTVVVKKVHHPGTKPTRFVEKTVQRLQDGPWMQLWERVVSRIVERLS